MENLTQDAQLYAFVDENEKKAKGNLIAMVTFAFLGIAPLIYILLDTDYGQKFFVSFNIIKVITLLVVTLLLQIPAFLLAWAFGKASDQASKFRSELIKLRDLDNAVDLSTGLSKPDLTEAEKDITSRIVKTLLDKYAN